MELFFNSDKFNFLQDAVH